MKLDDEVVVGVEVGVGVGVDTALADMGVSIGRHGLCSWQEWAPCISKVWTKHIIELEWALGYEQNLHMGSKQSTASAQATAQTAVIENGNPVATMQAAAAKQQHCQHKTHAVWNV